MKAQELLKEKNPSQALKALEDAVRKDPADPKLRIFLFQLLCVLGDWTRAMTQLGVVMEMDPKALLMVRTCKAAIDCELLRAEVFAGKRTPLIFGEPADWIAKIVQAAALDGQGKPQAAMALRDQAFENAPTTSGTIEVGPDHENIESHPIEWIADADAKLGPILEAMVDGKYYWIPYDRIRMIRIEKPEDLRDLVWAPCQFVWASGGQGVGFIPVRYPGTEKNGTDAQRMAAVTDMGDADGSDPRGQRLIGTDAGEFPLLSIRTIKLNPTLELQSPQSAEVAAE
jgi:type VI secretion system protein ImpE